MTGPEREDFRELREEMREGFRDIKEAVAAIAEKVHSLEISRAADEAVRNDRRIAASRVMSEKRWRIGLALGVGSSALLGVVNFIVEHKPGF